MKFLIKYATRGRPEWFRKTLTNIVDTISTKAIYLVLVSIDEDDATMNQEETNEFLKQKGCDYILACGKSTSKIDAINRDMGFVRGFGWDTLINMSDDMRFVIHGWDVIMENKIKEVWGSSLDFFAHFNDGYVGDKLPTMSIFGADYYKRDNYIYHPDYKSFSCDAEAMYVAQMRKRHYYFPDVLFLHEHHQNMGGVMVDETYKINALATPHDLKVYWSRLNRYFDEPVTPDTPIPFQEFIGKQPAGL